MEKPLTLSIVIPAYNEEGYLKACLQSIAAQTEPPDQVIVVDNNSTDKTAEIARSFPFVTLLKEERQGIVFARDRGFNAATSDIIGRINADSNLMSGWVERLKKDFERSEVMAITGLSLTSTFPFARALRTTFWSWAYYVVTDGYFRVRILWGANMAIRRQCWEKIRSYAWLDTFAHEDQDLSILVAQSGGRAVRDPHLLINSDGEGFHDWPKFARYMRMRWYTKAHHRKQRTLTDPNAAVIPLWRAIIMHWILLIPTILFIITSLVGVLPTLLRRRSK